MKGAASAALFVWPPRGGRAVRSKMNPKPLKNTGVARKSEHFCPRVKSGRSARKAILARRDATSGNTPANAPTRR